MAITHAIPEYWAAAVLRAFDTTYIWRDIVRDLSNEFAQGGNTLNLSEVTSDVTVKAYTRNAKIDAPERITDEEVKLVLDHEVYFNIAVDDVDKVQMKPDLMTEFNRKAGRAVAKDTDASISAEWKSTIPADHKMAGDAFPAANPTDAQAKAFAGRVLDGVFAMDNDDVPEDGRFVVFPRSVRNALIKWLALDKMGVNMNEAERNAFFNAQLSNFFGLTVRVDGTLKNPSAAGDYQALLGIPQACAFARQVRKVEPYRPPDEFSDAVKGLFVSGAKGIDPDGQYALTQKA